MNKILYIFVLWLILMGSGRSEAQEKVAIWEGTAVHAPSVTLEGYLPQGGERRPAVIVCPGGSYCWHDHENEGRLVAQWLQAHGFAAFVLNYRVQGIFAFITHSRLLVRGHQHPDMIMDLQRAIQYLREQADVYAIRPDRIGAMGFSAGGHLVMSAGEWFSTDFLQDAGITTHVSLRPDFVASIYPVVSLSHPDTHRRSRRALLGEWRKWRQSMRDSLSLEQHVTATCPPVFLVNCKDDPTVKYHNAEMLDSALTAHGVTHRYLQYQTGGHGFGASDVKGTAECRAWKNEFLSWYHSLFGE